ncbi:MAG: HAD family hydrolase [Pseudomonadota bacterium]
MARALILDCDGVLAHTEATHIACANKAFSDAGLDTSWDETLYARVTQTAGFRGQLTAYFGRFGWPKGEADNQDLLDQLTTRHRDLFVAAVRSGAVPLRDDVPELIDFAVSAGWKLAVCTDDHPDIASASVSRLGLQRASAIGVVVGGPDVQRPRPDPGLYLAVAERLGLAPEDCTAVVSRPFGAMAARSAGLTVSALAGPAANAASFGGAAMISKLDAGPQGLNLAA